MKLTLNHNCKPMQPGFSGRFIVRGYEWAIYNDIEGVAE